MSSRGTGLPPLSSSGSKSLVSKSCRACSCTPPPKPVDSLFLRDVAGEPVFPVRAGWLREELEAPLANDLHRKALPCHRAPVVLAAIAGLNHPNLSLAHPCTSSRRSQTKLQSRHSSCAQ